jgi:phosphatidylinositol alpha-mannosyltransferase
MVATFHRSGPSALYRVAGRLAAPATRRMEARCAVSAAAAATASDALGGSYRIVPNAVDVTGYEAATPWPSSGRAILFLGRHEERKGLGVPLEAFAALSAGGRVPDAELWVAGDGPQTSALRTRYADLSGCRWLGVVTEEEKRRRLAAADVLCAPSLGGESFGVVLLEGMAAGALVVASDIDGYRQAAGGMAELVAPGDPGALAGALAAALTLPPDEHQDRIARARAHAAMSGMDAAAGAYEQVYRQVVAGRA